MCEWIDEPSLAPHLSTPPSGSNALGLEFAAHEVLVLERFAQKAAKSREFRVHLAQHFANLNQQVEGGIVRISREQGESDDLINFKLEKWNSIYTPRMEHLILDQVDVTDYGQWLLDDNVVDVADYFD